MSKDSKRKIFQMLSHIIVQAFTLTFLAEWGDRSQISTMALAMKDVSLHFFFKRRFFIHFQVSTRRKKKKSIVNEYHFSLYSQRNRHRTSFILTHLS